MARVLKGSHSFTCTARVHPLSLPSHPKLVLIYRIRRDGRLSIIIAEMAMSGPFVFIRLRVVLLTTFRTNSHSSFDFNFFAFNPWELYIQGY